jgi:SAM-dependent methyltransferase
MDTSMSVAAMYNKTENHYSTANRFGSISVSHKCAINQIINAHLGFQPHYKVLDLGVGDGTFLHKLREHIPQSKFTGIDISSEMLRHAKDTLPLTTIETSATEASHYLPHHSQDLVLAHFINAYIPLEKLFDQAKLLTRANGHFSIITTTYDSFPSAQMQLAEFVSKESILSKIVGHYYKAIIKNTTVAAGENALMDAFTQHQFKVVSHQRLSIPITLNNADELVLFGMEGTWFLNSVAIRMLPKKFLFQRLKRLFSKIFTYPYQDTHIIDVVLAKK